MNDEMLELLYRSFDEELTAEQSKVLEDALAVSEDLRKEKSRIAAMRKMVAESGMDSFRPFFAERVMRRIEDLRGGESSLWTLQEWLPRVFRRVAVVGVAVAGFLAIFNLAQSEGISVAAAFGMSEGSIEEILELPVESILEGIS
jgi:hypothetical protein